MPKLFAVSIEDDQQWQRRLRAERPDLWDIRRAPPRYRPATMEI
jgi:hypothetical protein